MKRYGPIALIYLIMFGVLLVVDHYPFLNDVGLSQLPVLLTIYVGFRWNEAAGILFGLAAGLTTIGLDGGPLTLALLVPMTAGWLAGMLPDRIDIVPLPIQLILVILFTPVAMLAQSLIIDKTWFFMGFWTFVVTLILTPTLAGFLFPLGDRLFDPPRSTRAKALELTAEHRVGPR
jgi:hypothetical protein